MSFLTDRSPVPLRALEGLFLAGLTAASTESTIVGLLPRVGEQLGVQDDSLLGIVITLYMAGVVVGAPLFTVVLVRVNRQYLLMLAVMTQVAGNLATACASHYGVLLAARFLTGLPHGAIYGLVALLAASMAPPDRKARVVSLAFVGVPVGNLVMVPCITSVGQHVSFRAAFLIIAVCGLLTCLALWRGLPDMSHIPPSHPAQEMRVLRNKQVILTLLAGLIGFPGLYAFLSYMALGVTTIAGLPAHYLPAIMMLTGMGSLCGIMLHGQLYDRFPRITFPIVLLCFTLTLLAAPLMMRSIPTACCEIFLVSCWGTGAFPQAMQLRLMDHAGDAQNFAASLNHAALCGANALGSAISSAVVARHLGGHLVYAYPALLCSALGAVGLIIILVAVRMAPARPSQPPAHPSHQGDPVCPSPSLQ